MLDDVERTPKWFARCTRVDKLEPGANALGTKLRYTVMQRAQSTGTMDGSIVAYARDQHIAFRMTDGMFEVTIDFKLSPTATGTRLSHQIDVVPRGFVGKLIQPILRRVLPGQVAADMARLRELV